MLFAACACIIHSSRLIKTNIKKWHIYSSCLLSLLSTLALFIVLPGILLLTPFMLLKTSFSFVPPYWHRADKDRSLAVLIETDSVAKM